MELFEDDTGYGINFGLALLQISSFVRPLLNVELSPRCFSLLLGGERRGVLSSNLPNFSSFPFSGVRVAKIVCLWFISRTGVGDRS